MVYLDWNPPGRCQRTTVKTNLKVENMAYCLKARTDPRITYERYLKTEFVFPH